MAKIITDSAAPTKAVHNSAGSAKIAAPVRTMFIYLNGNLMLNGTVDLDGVVSTGDAPAKVVMGVVQ